MRAKFGKFEVLLFPLAHLRHAKGQLISKCPVVAFKSPKNPSEKFPGFLPYPLKRGQIKKVV